jgi:hypothetical protein
MARTNFVTLVATAAAIALLGGCGGQMTGRDSRLAGPSPVGANGRAPLAGTWRGSIYDHSPQSRSGVQDATIEIKDDQTFTGKTGQAAPLAGTVAERGNRVVLRSSRGDIILTRSGNTLYGVTHDPATAATVMIRLDKAENAP